MHVLRAPVAEDAGAVGLPVSGIAEDPYTIEICHAYDAIRTGKPFDVTAEDALESLRIALAPNPEPQTPNPKLKPSRPPSIIVATTGWSLLADPLEGVRSVGAVK